MKNIRELLQEINFEIELSEIYEEGDTFEYFCNKVLDRIREEEIIYYSEAMKYLSENDPSLTESLALAEEFGYSPAKLNSEILATLLYQQNLESDFCELTSKIEEIFEE